jgi:hypothetical protein
MRTKYVKSFIFDRANYLVSDGSRQVTLKVDYKNNRYVVDGIEGRLPQQLRKELNAIAGNLLLRKHNRNFAEPADVQ